MNKYKKYLYFCLNHDIVNLTGRLLPIVVISKNSLTVKDRNKNVRRRYYEDKYS